VGLGEEGPEDCVRMRDILGEGLCYAREDGADGLHV
jgi:hypothetical protein